MHWTPLLRSSLVVAAVALFVAAADAALPDLMVDFTSAKPGGVQVLNGGDGANKPETVAGAAARRMSGERSLYLYVAITNREWRGPVDAYVTVEVFDEALARVSLQYDKNSPTPNVGSKYSAAAETLFLTESRQWRRGVFYLPALRVGHGQNGGADFRLAGRHLAVRKITLSTQPPQDWNPDQPIDAAALAAVRVERPAGMELTYGNDASPADAAVFKALSVTSVESYVDWAGVEPKRDEWDWSRWDKQVDTLQKAGLNWVPFLIAGSAYATPLWFHNSPQSHYYRCLEHGRDSKVQSLFSPELKPAVDRFLRTFAERYRDKNVIESLLLGVTGIYGESIYPAGPEGGWTARLTGDYHNHAGWWAGDAEAVKAFRTAMQRQYGDITALNRAWGASHSSFNDVTTFLPDKAPSDRARADLVEWYQQAMTDWAVFWVSTTRKYFPKTEIYLCTGGDGNPMLGADFTAQTAAIRGEQAGVRITNEGSDYAHNFAITREVATATRLYQTYCGFEPASAVDSNGVVARVYNATASGARQLHDYIPNTLGSDANSLRNFRANAHYIVPRKPQIDAALYLSRETWALDGSAVGRTLALSRTLRDFTDIDFVTRNTVADGFLRQYRALVLADSAVLEPRAAEAIEAWVQNGGTLIAVARTNETLASRLYDHTAWRSRLLPAQNAAVRLTRPALAGAAPEHWRLNLGREDEAWLEGAWFDPEKRTFWNEITNATTRWAGGDSTILLPVTPGRDHRLTLSAHVPGGALGTDGVQLRINGALLGTIRQAGRRDWSFTVPSALIANAPVVRLQIISKTWRPSEHEQGNKDDRHLGIAVRQVDVARAGSEAVPAAAAKLTMAIDEAALHSISRPRGRGRTIFLSGKEVSPKLIGSVLARVLGRHSEGGFDNRFVTHTETGDVVLDATTRPPRILQK